MIQLVDRVFHVCLRAPFEYLKDDWEAWKKRIKEKEEGSLLSCRFSSVLSRSWSTRWVLLRRPLTSALSISHSSCDFYINFCQPSDVLCFFLSIPVDSCQSDWSWSCQGWVDNFSQLSQTISKRREYSRYHCNSYATIYITKETFKSLSVLIMSVLLFRFSRSLLILSWSTPESLLIRLWPTAGPLLIRSWSTTFEFFSPFSWLSLVSTFLDALLLTFALFTPLITLL